MRIRVSGTTEECNSFIQKLRRSGICEVQSVSSFRPWTRNDPKSKIGAVYVDLALDEYNIIDITPTAAEASAPISDDQLKLIVNETINRFLGKGDQ